MTEIDRGAEVLCNMSFQLLKKQQQTTCFFFIFHRLDYLNVCPGPFIFFVHLCARAAHITYCNLFLYEMTASLSKSFI